MCLQTLTGTARAVRGLLLANPPTKLHMKKNQMKRLVTVSSLVCALAACLDGVALLAQSAAENPIIINRNASSYDNPVSRVYTGRSPYMESAPTAAPAPARAEPGRPGSAATADRRESCWGW